MPRQMRDKWRRVIACAVAYALAAQSLVFALAIGQAASAADGVNDPNWRGFVLCSHLASDQSSTATKAPAPLQQTHCPFCLAGAIYVSCVPPATPPWNEVVLNTAIWLPVAQPLIALVIDGSGWPRGPPIAA